MKRTMAAELAAAQKDTQRRRGPDAAEQPAHAEQVHVVDRIRAGDHASHQRRHRDPELAPWSPDTSGTRPARPTHLELNRWSATLAKAVDLRRARTGPGQ